MLILKGHDVLALLAGREESVVGVVRAAYEAHARGQSALPHSVFLRFPDSQLNRIIALPAFLGGEHGGAGIKWVSSFPGNLDRGLERASAVIILNSLEDGRPRALLEGSVISAKRTAASAALAARTLRGGRGPVELSLVGCGMINFEVVRFVASTCGGVAGLHLYDLDESRARQFKEKCERTFDGLRPTVSKDLSTALGAAPLLSIATTAVTPYISDLSAVAPGGVILHLSLRDITPEALLACDSVVDDIDHVCRAQTSVHLAEQLAGNRDFIHCTLADITTGSAEARSGAGAVTIFSPFGLGVLDIALSRLVYDLAVKEGKGLVLDSFMPESWLERDEAASALT
jgi:ornithine cyclodeaminase